MATANQPPSDALTSLDDEQKAADGYGASNGYVHALAGRDKDRLKLRGLLLEGAASAPTAVADGVYFDGLRKVARARRERQG